MNPTQNSKRRGRKPDVSTLFGLQLALAGLLGGLTLEGGRFSDVGRLTTAIIMAGGPFGAVMITTPFTTLRAALSALPSVFLDRTDRAGALIDEILVLATKARKGGLVSLENDALQIGDPFLKKALLLVVDGADLQDMRRIMELELDLIERHGEAEVKVFEAAGGFAPTIGIIGAVLGLIQVMKHLEDIEAVGHGIAVAFVATVYGVALANVFLLPAAHKLKLRLQQVLQTKELMLEGVIGVAEGLNPKLIQSKLEAFQRNEPSRRAEARDSKVRSVAKARTA